MKFCKDCKWCDPMGPSQNDWGDGVCRAPQNLDKPDVITGEQRLRFGTARILREIEPHFDGCGPEAAWFVPRGSKK